MFAAIVALFGFLFFVVVVGLLPDVKVQVPRQAAQEPRPGSETAENAPPLTSTTTYWEQDKFGLWRLWNHDRKNLALVADQLEGYEDWVLWRVFTTYLRPSVNGYQLIEREDLLQMGLTPDPQAWTAEVSGWAQTIPGGKQRVVDTIKHIQE